MSITLKCSVPGCDNTYEEENTTQGAEYFCHQHVISQPMTEEKTPLEEFVDVVNEVAAQIPKEVLTSSADIVPDSDSEPEGEGCTEPYSITYLSDSLSLLPDEASRRDLGSAAPPDRVGIGTLRPDAGEDLVIEGDEDKNMLLSRGPPHPTVPPEEKIIVTLTDDQIAELRVIIAKSTDIRNAHAPMLPIVPPYPTETLKELREMIDDLIFHIERSPCGCDACQGQYADDSKKLIYEIRRKI